MTPRRSASTTGNGIVALVAGSGGGRGARLFFSTAARPRSTRETAAAVPAAVGKHRGAGRFAVLRIPAAFEIASLVLLVAVVGSVIMARRGSEDASGDHGSLPGIERGPAASSGPSACSTRRNIVVILMSIELILNAVNINLIAFSHAWHNVAARFSPFSSSPTRSPKRPSGWAS